MRRALLALVAACLAGAAVLVYVAATDRPDVAFSVGLPAIRVATEIQPGQERCRGGIDVAAAFTRARIPVATFGRPGPALAVTLREETTGRVVGRGRVAAGYADNSAVQTRVGAVPAGGRVRVCVRDAGGARVALLGSPPATLASELADPSLQAEPAVVFLTDGSPSVLSRLPTLLRRAAVFKAGWVGSWTFWLLLAAVSIGLPLLLAGAVRAAYASERS
jgi:hypothetical protein